MPPDAMPSLTVLLLVSRPVRARKFKDSIEATPGVTLAASVWNLTQAYNLTEHAPPDMVVLAEEETQRDNFPMYDAMLKALEIRCLVIRAADSMPPAAGHPAASLDEIDAAGGLGPYLNAHCRPGRTPPRRNALAPAPVPNEAPGDRKTVVIGASTGGVEALIEILSRYPADCPPTLVVQHINARFLPGLAQRLDRHSAATVRPAEASDRIAPGLVLLAPGNSEHLTIVPPGGRCRMTPGAPVSGHRPSVDALFHSAARLGPGVVGVLLSGMGRDGAEGLAAIRGAGGATIAQDEASSIVFGMPRAAQVLGAVERQLPLGRIADAILAAARTGERMPND